MCRWAHVPMCFLLFVMYVCMRIGVGGQIGGLENVRNVEECNQNVLLCGQQQKKRGGEKRNTVASSLGMK